MIVKNLITAVAVFAAAGSAFAFAQQTEFSEPDASFKSTLTRAEVRQQMVQAHSQGKLVMQQHTGQDPVYAKGQRSRAEVRAEAVEEARQHHAVDVSSPYFG
jgi:precorrin-4 methylase